MNKLFFVRIDEDKGDTINIIVRADEGEVTADFRKRDIEQALEHKGLDVLKVAVANMKRRIHMEHVGVTKEDDTELSNEIMDLYDE